MCIDLTASFELDCSAFTKALKEFQGEAGRVLHLMNTTEEPKVEILTPPILQCDGCGSRQFIYKESHNECEFCGNHYPPFNHKPITILTSVL